MTQKRGKPAPSFNWRAYSLVVGPVVLVLIGVAIYMVLAEDQETKAIRTLIETARECVIEKDVDRCLPLLHESYTDNLDNDYETVAANAGKSFDEVSDIAVKLRRFEIEVERGLATAKFEMRATAKIDEGLGRSIPVAGVVSTKPAIGPNWEAVTLQFLKRDGNWLVTRMIVQPIGRPTL